MWVMLGVGEAKCKIRSSGGNGYSRIKVVGEAKYRIKCIR